MLVKIATGATCAVLLAATPALAVTITNQYNQSQTVTVNHGTSETQVAVAPGKTAQVDCPQTCGFRGQAYGYSRVVGGDSKLVIDKDAELHVEGGGGDMLMPDGST